MVDSSLDGTHLFRYQAIYDSSSRHNYLKVFWLLETDASFCFLVQIRLTHNTENLLNNQQNWITIPFFLYVEHNKQEMKPYNIPAKVVHAECLICSNGEVQDGELVFDFIFPCSDYESGLDVV